MEVCSGGLANDVENGFLCLFNFIVEIRAVLIVDENPLLVTHVGLS